jgi:hypothetical protein
MERTLEKHSSNDDEDEKEEEKKNLPHLAGICHQHVDTSIDSHLNGGADGWVIFYNIIILLVSLFSTSIHVRAV